MTTAVPTSSATKSAMSVDIPSVARSGSLLALGLVFIALAGMPVGLDSRAVISGILSLGYLSLVWLPIIVGWAASKQVVLEGVESSGYGTNDIVKGGLVGAIGGLGLSVLLVLVDAFNLRDPLVNWSPQLVEFLSFTQGKAFGFIVWPILCGALGALALAFTSCPISFAARS